MAVPDDHELHQSTIPSIRTSGALMHENTASGAADQLF